MSLRLRWAKNPIKTLISLTIYSVFDNPTLTIMFLKQDMNMNIKNRLHRLYRSHYVCQNLFEVGILWQLQPLHHICSTRRMVDLYTDNDRHLFRSSPEEVLYHDKSLGWQIAACMYRCMEMFVRAIRCLLDKFHLELLSLVNRWRNMDRVVWLDVH